VTAIGPVLRFDEIGTVFSMFNPFSLYVGNAPII